MIFEINKNHYANVGRGLGEVQRTSSKEITLKRTLEPTADFKTSRPHSIRRQFLYPICQAGCHAFEAIQREKQFSYVQPKKKNRSALLCIWTERRKLSSTFRNSETMWAQKGQTTSESRYKNDTTSKHPVHDFVLQIPQMLSGN